MDRLWAPWRLSYVAAPQAPAAGDACFLCRAVAEDRDRDNMLAWRGKHGFVILNRFPYNNGHLLIAPNAHKAHLQDVSADEHLEMQEAMARLVGVLTDMMKPEGFNVGLNLGKVAGAGVPGHLHWHLVPRWNGDTNFMPVLTDTRVIVQSLEAFYDLLKPRLY